MDISAHLIPHSVRRNLAVYLEPCGPIRGYGWKLLMEKFGFSPAKIEFVQWAPKASPGLTNTEQMLMEYASIGGTVGGLMKTLEDIEYNDALKVLQDSLPEIIQSYKRHSCGENCQATLKNYQQNHQRCHVVERPARPPPPVEGHGGYNGRPETSMTAEASSCPASMDREETVMDTGQPGYLEERPVAMADVLLRGLNQDAPFLSDTCSYDSNNNDEESEIKALLRNPPPDIKPREDELSVSQMTEQQGRLLPHYSHYSTAATKKNVSDELIPKKEDEKGSCCHGKYHNIDFGNDVRPKQRTNLQSQPLYNRPTGPVIDAHAQRATAPLHAVTNGHEVSGKKRMRIFVTHVRDDDRHMKRVSSLLQFLRSNGFSVCVDLYENREGDSPGEVLKQSLNRLKQFQIGFVLFCISPLYKKAVCGSDDGKNDTKHLNAKAIYRMMEEEYFNINKNTAPFSKRRYRSVPVLFTDSKAKSCDIPDWLKNCGPVYEWPEHYRHLAYYLSQPESCFDDPLDTKSCITQSLTSC